MPLPPDVSQRDFDAALREFRRTVGDEWVFASDAEVDLYRDAYSPFTNEDDDPVPSAAVAPQSTQRYQGAIPALLEERTDLTQQYIESFVRMGVGVMPQFRKTEITDAELDAMVRYLTNGELK